MIYIYIYAIYIFVRVLLAGTERGMHEKNFTLKDWQNLAIQKWDGVG